MIKLFENYSNLEYIKSEILEKAFETCDVDIIDFFHKKGYNILNLKLFYESTYNLDVFIYMLNNINNLEEFLDVDKNDSYYIDKIIYNFIRLEIQKTLIDHGHANIIFKFTKFHNDLKKDPKYSKIVDFYENVENFNI